MYTWSGLIVAYFPLGHALAFTMLLIFFVDSPLAASWPTMLACGMYCFYLYHLVSTAPADEPCRGAHELTCCSVTPP